VWDGFLEGYRVERSLSDQDLDAIPLFMVMLRIYMLGFVAAHRHTTPWAGPMLRDGFVESELQSLRRWARTEPEQGVGKG